MSGKIAPFSVSVLLSPFADSNIMRASLKELREQRPGKVGVPPNRRARKTVGGTVSVVYQQIIRPDAVRMLCRQVGLAMEQHGIDRNITENIIKHRCQSDGKFPLTRLLLASKSIFESIFQLGQLFFKSSFVTTLKSS